MSASTSSTSAAAGVLERALDADAHEMVPSHLWGEVFGEACGLIGERAVDLLKKATGQKLYNPELNEDVGEISDETVWHIRGSDVEVGGDAVPLKPEVIAHGGLQQRAEHAVAHEADVV